MRPPAARTLGGALLLLALALGTAEGLLRLLPLARWEPQFAGERAWPVFVRGTGGQADRYLTNDHYRGYLNYQTFAYEKPPGTFRIFVLGGSAAFGYPYGERWGFSGILRRALEAAAPGRFEVVNAAGMSYGSLRVLDFLREVVASYQPDLVVVFEANNEYVERNALPAGSTPPQALPAARRVLRSSALYRGLRLLIFRAAPRRFEDRAAGDLTDLRSNPVARGNLGRSPRIDAEVLANFRHNLREMARTLEQAKIPGVFCTVPVNLADWAPDPGQPPFTGQEAMLRWREALDAGRSALGSGKNAAALERLAAARALAPDDPYTTFWHGKALQRAGKLEAARAAFLLARDGDPRVLRALSSFNREIRDLPAGRRRISVLDLEADFEAASPGGPGEDLFVDYVHENEAGHRRIALALLPAIGKASGGDLPLEPAAWLVRNDPGYGDDGTARMRETFARAMTFQQNGRWDEAERGYEAVLREAPEFREALANLGDLVALRGDRRRALQLYEKALASAPPTVPVLIGFGALLRDLGQGERAAGAFSRALELNPLNPVAHAGLGLIAAAQGNHREAIAHFERAGELGFSTPEMHRVWGSALLALGRREEAAAQWERGLALDPLDDDMRRRLAALRGGGR